MSETETAVVEEPEATPAQRWQALQRQHDLAAQRLAQLAGLTLEEADEQLKLERWLQNIQPQLERLHHEMLYAQAQVDVVGIKSAHDEHIPAKKACHERIAHAYTELFAAFQALEVLHNQQIAPLERLTRPGSAEPAIAVRTGAEVARDVANRLPGAMGLHMVLFAPTSRGLTRGDLEQMQDADPGLRELNPRVLERYLAGLRA
jgi:hypothetical protein